MKRVVATAIRKKVEDALDGIDFYKEVFTPKRRIIIFLLWVWPPARMRKINMLHELKDRLEDQYRKQFYKDVKREYQRLKKQG
jgi:hypothetical protein